MYIQKAKQTNNLLLNNLMPWYPSIGGRRYIQVYMTANGCSNFSKGRVEEIKGGG